jgi:large subunit ribosomal protein L25
MDQQLHAVEVECLPSDIPEVITVNIEEMEVGSVLHVSDLPEFAGVKFLTISEQVVISITAPHIEEEPEVEEEEGEELLEGEEGASEETEEGEEAESEE